MVAGTESEGSGSGLDRIAPSGFGQELMTEHSDGFADVAGIELIVVDTDTQLREVRQQFR